METLQGGGGIQGRDWTLGCVATRGEFASRWSRIASTAKHEQNRSGGEGKEDEQFHGQIVVEHNILFKLKVAEILTPGKIRIQIRGGYSLID